VLIVCVGIFWHKGFCKKAACKMLVKLRPVLCTAFTSADPWSVKTVKLLIFFTLSESASVKDVSKTLVKLTPGLNFINVLRTAFTLVDPKSVKRHWWPSCIFYAFGIYERKSCIDDVASKSGSGQDPWFDFVEVHSPYLDTISTRFYEQLLGKYSFAKNYTAKL